MNIVAQSIDIHSFAVLIDAQTKTSANFLSLTDITAALLQSTNLEDIGVVPAFTESRVREDETNRRFLRISVQQKFLVLHNQVIGINIVRSGFLLAEFGVNHLALLINGEIASMGVLRANHVQILDVVIITELTLQRFHDISVFFLEHISIDAVEGLSCLIVLLVLHDLINEEQGQNLDTLVEQFSFSLDMGQDGFSNLDTA